MLDKTLIAIGAEFGRPSSYDGRGGRGHQGNCFTLVLAGGGLKTRPHHQRRQAHRRAVPLISDANS